MGPDTLAVQLTRFRPFAHLFFAFLVVRTGGEWAARKFFFGFFFVCFPGTYTETGLCVALVKHLSVNREMQKQFSLSYPGVTPLQYLSGERTEE